MFDVWLTTNKRLPINTNSDQIENWGCAARDIHGNIEIANHRWKSPLDIDLNEGKKNKTKFFFRKKVHLVGDVFKRRSSYQYVMSTQISMRNEIWDF